jgi:hypothetical protein
LFFVAMAVGSALVAWGSVSYFIEGDVHPFILEKEPLPLESVWISALYVHVVAAAWSLPACLLLLSRRMLRYRPRLHRWLGRITGAVVLFALVPSGGWLALFAKGGIASTIGFLLSGAIVFAAMIIGIKTVRAGELVAHRRSMVHVAAQLSVAVTSRAMLVVFDRAGLDEEIAYLIALWVPVIGSAIAAELIAGGWNILHRREHENARLHPLSLDAAR